jgi:hypothetical protein
VSAPIDLPANSGFIAVLTQASEGCDFSIGCGVKLVPLDAKTPDEAIAAAKELLREYQHVEHRLKSLQILAVAGRFPAPLTKWYRDLDNEDLAREQEKERQKDLAELERLQKKLGK